MTKSVTAPVSSFRRKPESSDFAFMRLPKKKWHWIPAFAGMTSLLLAALLSGCNETRFESPLGDNIETCDSHWKGLWTGDEPESNTPGAFWIDDDCRFTVLDQPEKGGPFKQIHVPVNYVHDGGKDYLVVADNVLKGLVELKPPYGIDPLPAKSYFFARYRTHGDRIDVYSVNDANVAKLILDGKLQGTISKTANELHVYVRGDRAQMLEIVRHDSIFEDKTDTVLSRIKQTPADYEKSVIQSQKTKNP
jgi:hypothetical protein